MPAQMRPESLLGRRESTPRQLDALTTRDAISPLNYGFGAHSGPSRGDRSRRAIRPFEASGTAIRYVRKTSTPPVIGVAERTASAGRCRRITVSGAPYETFPLSDLRQHRLFREPDLWP